MKIGKIKIPPILFILIIFVSGILSGMLYMVLKSDNWFIKEEIFSQIYMYKIEDMDIDKRACFILCFVKRMKSFLLLFLLAFSSINFITNTVFFFTYGFSFGCLMQLLVIRYGMQGMGIFFSMTLPHAFFYFLGFLSLGCWCLGMENNERCLRNKKKEKLREIQRKRNVVIAFLFIFSGVLFESFFNLGKLLFSFLIHSN